MILPGGRSARATRAGQYLLQLGLDLELQLQRRAAKKSCWPSSSQPLLACGQPPSSLLDPPEEGFRARHLISTSTIVVLHYTGSNILTTGDAIRLPSASRSRARPRKESLRLVRVRTFVHAATCTNAQMRTNKKQPPRTNTL